MNKDVRKVSSTDNKVTESNDKITLKTDEKYEVGDIILIDNKQAYKIEKVEKEKYQLSIPKLTEVFDEIDYYGSAYVNLKDFEENPEIEEYLIAYAEENLINKIIPRVSAAPKISVSCRWDNKKEAMIAKISVSTEPGDKVFNKSFLDNHKLTFDYEVSLKIKFDYDIKDDNVDMNFTLEVQNVPSFKIAAESQTLTQIKDSLKLYTKDEDSAKSLKSDYNKVKTDAKKLKQPVGTIMIPTPLWFITANLDLGLIMEFNLKANAEATLTNTNKISMGVSSKKGIYGNTKSTNKINANAFGEAGINLGSQIDLGVSLLEIAEISGGIKGGLYGKASLDIKSELSNGIISAELLATTKAGLFANIVIGAKLGTKTFEKELTNTELELFSKELPLSASNEDSEAVIKEEDNESPKHEDSNQGEQVEYIGEGLASAEIMINYMNAINKNNISEAKSYELKTIYPDIYNELVGKKSLNGQGKFFSNQELMDNKKTFFSQDNGYYMISISGEFGLDVKYNNYNSKRHAVLIVYCTNNACTGTNTFYVAYEMEMVEIKGNYYVAGVKLYEDYDKNIRKAYDALIKYKGDTSKITAKDIS